MSDVREFKYLVGYNAKTKRFKIGYTRTWLFHADILPEFGEGFKPFSAGYFRIGLEKTDWVVDTVEVYGKSEGFHISPIPTQDVEMIKLMMQGENDGDYIREFDRERKPIDDSTPQIR